MLIFLSSIYIWPDEPQIFLCYMRARGARDILPCYYWLFLKAVCNCIESMILSVRPLIDVDTYIHHQIIASRINIPMPGRGSTAYLSLMYVNIILSTQLPSSLFLSKPSIHLLYIPFFRCMQKAAM